MSTNSIRDVAQKEIYDSYLGILRISPNFDEDLYENVDDPSSLLRDLNASIRISDSDGDALNHWILPCVDTLKSYSQTNNDLILCSHYIPSYIIKNSLNVSSMIIVEKNENKFGNFAIMEYTNESNNVLYYPKFSPNDSSYFNDKGELAKETYTDPIEITSESYGESRVEELNQKLYERSKEWYNQIDRKHWVNIGDEENPKYVLYANKDLEDIPALYTKDYILGAYNCKNTYGEDGITPFDVFNGNQNMDNKTELSWIEIDKIIWKLIKDCKDGKYRHYKGHYENLVSDDESTSDLSEIYGELNNSDILLYGGGTNPIYAANQKSRRFSIVENIAQDNNLKNTAPLLGVDVQAGVMSYNAMDIKRYLFYCQKQKSYNNKLRGVEDSQNVKDANITPMDRCNLCFTNNLSKNYLICDGKEITKNNYPNINYFNENIFGDYETNGFDYGMQEIPQDSLSGVYYALSNNFGGTLRTPKLLYANDDKTPIYVRGANWDFSNYSITNGVVMNDSELEDLDNLESVTIINDFNAFSGANKPFEIQTYVQDLVGGEVSLHPQENIKYEIIDFTDETRYVLYIMFNKDTKINQVAIKSVEGDLYHNTIYYSYDFDCNFSEHSHYQMKSVDVTTDWDSNGSGNIYIGRWNGHHQTTRDYYGEGWMTSDGKYGLPKTDYPGRSGKWTNSNSWNEYNKSLQETYCGAHIPKNYTVFNIIGEDDADNYDSEGNKTGLGKRYSKEKELLTTKLNTDEFLYSNTAIQNEIEASYTLACSGGYYNLWKASHMISYFNKKGTWKRSKKWAWAMLPQNNRNQYYSFRKGTSSDDSSSIFNRCLTSLPFKNYDQLGVIETDENGNKRVNKNGYTSQFRKMVSSSEAQSSNDTDNGVIPPSLFFTPLIRI